MRRARFDPDELAGPDRLKWQRLVAAAKTAESRLADDRRDGREHDWRSNVWRGFKEFFFLNVFFGMCAYCESDVESVYVGDAEHYRPKGKVTQREGDREIEVTCPDGNPHPGYYWLAYDWRNILPSCYKCNTHFGKGTQFPARRHACSPDVGADPNALDAFEEPFLLHPFKPNYDPKKYLIFDNLGGIASKDEDEAAAITIDVFDLDRKGLNPKRIDQQKLAWDGFKKARERAAEDDSPLGDPLAEYRHGRRPHSIAALQHVARMIEREAQLNMEALAE
jgi:hypothetical protein